MTEELNYDSLLIDTSVFDGNGLRLEKGLLGKLSQFKRSPVDFIMPDVIYNEVKSHLERKIKESRSGLEKSINDAGDHLFFDGSTLNDARELLLGSNEIEGLADTRLKSFLDNSGAIVIECGNHLNVSDLLAHYFSNNAPFSESGKKKNEFPDAIILMAIEAWAKTNNKFILAISKDDDWSRYGETSERITCLSELSDGLALFNKANAPYAFLSRLETALDEDTAEVFLDGISSRLESDLDGFTPDQDADSYFYWEPDGSNGWFKNVYLTSHEFRIIESDDKYIVLEVNAAITVEAEGEFSLSVHDSIDRDYSYVGSVTATKEEEFDSKLLITISGDLDGPIEDLVIEEVEIVTPLKRINFGTLEPDFGDPE
ncbi:PIN domain-containing protein [Pseudomonas nunensis]|uniref:PIN domain-containing protein n=1 Tax=Pseudomonas nunensis TaxID=2961896 RepID=UPI0025AFDFCC|nr:PIN domain-containing protein [Pseudomonas nunensis]MDN3224055.1 PIN domain-containing protein [Pseudomonas nunensis]